jgi:ketosteroid isomerase-like protein
MTKIQLAGATMAMLMAALVGACGRPESAKPAVDTGKIADAVKADEAQLLADFNAHDAAKVASHDAPDVVQMAHGGPNLVGPAADLAADQKGFVDDPSQHFAIANESVDVAASGEMAVYRSTYVYNFVDPKTKKPVTETGNYLAGYRLQPDGSWKIAWSIIADTAPPPAPASATPAAKS